MLGCSLVLLVGGNESAVCSVFKNTIRRHGSWIKTELNNYNNNYNIIITFFKLLLLKIIVDHPLCRPLWRSLLPR